MARDGSPRAWAFLRRNPDYRAAWREASEQPALESAPFAVRVQSVLDRKALAWGLLAWEGAQGPHGPASPFWPEAPMLDGE